jgi:hypothetical protein
MKILKYAYLLASRKRLSFCLRSFEKTLSFAFHLSAGRRGEKVFIFRCVGDCGGLRRFLRGFHLSALTYPPDPAVLVPRNPINIYSTLAYI